MISFILVSNNGVFGVVDGGPSKAVADGFYVLTEPIPAGNHTVQFKSSLSSPSYASDMTYHLIVK